jgi:hypothetical protein
VTQPVACLPAGDRDDPGPDRGLAAKRRRATPRA